MSEQAERFLREQAARYGATPHYAPVQRWCDISGVGRTKTYELLGIGFLRAVKLDSRTLIDVWHGLDALAALPSADIRPQGRQATKQPEPELPVRPPLPPRRTRQQPREIHPE